MSSFRLVEKNMKFLFYYTSIASIHLTKGSLSKWWTFLYLYFWLLTVFSIYGALKYISKSHLYGSTKWNNLLYPMLMLFWTLEKSATLYKTVRPLWDIIISDFLNVIIIMEDCANLCIFYLKVQHLHIQTTFYETCSRPTKIVFMCCD